MEYLFSNSTVVVNFSASNIFWCARILEILKIIKVEFQHISVCETGKFCCWLYRGQVMIISLNNSVAEVYLPTKRINNN